MKDILKTITEYRTERGWTEYHLSERSELPQSTISSWYRKGTVPTLASLEKICTAFGVTLSQILAENDDPVTLTTEQRELLERWTRLTPEQQEVIFQLLDLM
ncbi:MAG: helix-turn-helix transcriptional regulator [Firmicutes bacterium]|nr:helix-turn-helix transcriptional regulator [Bacillota bacterium]MBQ4505516.1 helix-turn-helix transcriptional regulator [Bacillota bacterium]MBQ6686294.1 helix-turn-helix transcriptional regulator [Bacillota bacterium]